MTEQEAEKMANEGLPTDDEIEVDEDFDDAGFVDEDDEDDFDNDDDDDFIDDEDE